MVARDSSPEFLRAPRLGDDGGRTALLVDGVVQSVAVTSFNNRDGYWWEMLPDVRPTRALLLGLGGGTVAQLLLMRFGLVPMVGVECNEHVLELARSSFLAAVPMEYRLADAHEYLAAAEPGFDYVCVDLFHGEEADRRISGRPFLRHLQRVVTRGGTICFNLFRDKRTALSVARISRGLRIIRQIECGKNIIVHAKVS
ncbi:MAG: methyltransferase domain-containing protein [Chloroflexota bacterium]